MGDANAQFIVRYWGVRGSIPTPGQDTVRYGGNTTCLEFRCDDQVFVIDTGTGARLLGTSLMKEAAGEGLNVTILYSHHHLDHVQGFPFFVPIYSPKNTLNVYCGAPPNTTESVLNSQMTYPSFPVGLDSLPANVTFHNFEPGESLKFGDVQVDTCALNHPGGAVAYRVNHRGRSFVQASDTEHEGDTPDHRLVELCRDADYLSYDSTYVNGEEYELYRGWGHSTWYHGLQVAEAAGTGTFVVFHHDPSHNDDFMDGLAKNVEAARAGSLVAREGMTFDMLAGTVSTES
jgi:phosphoribosyl 1,2-cyclic phosphodiesterase